MKKILVFLYLGILTISLYPQSSYGWSNHLPDRLNLDILPASVSATHLRGVGFGLSLEKINKQTETLTAIQGDLSFPFMQKRDGKNNFIDGPADWNGSLNLMAMIKPTIYIGGKVGASMLVPDGPIGFAAISFRIIPPNSEDWHFFTFCTKHLDVGVYANGHMYAAIRLGFQLYKIEP